jgi:DNA-binding MarR family transcriptional regulator
MNKAENQLKLEAAMDAMRRAMMGARERLGEGLQLTRTQLEILMVFSEKPRTTSELARLLMLTQGAVTQTIDTLVRRDLIERHHEEHDRRIVRLKLTPAGMKITDHLRNLHHKSMHSLIELLTDAETDLLIAVTEKMTTLFNDNAESINKK